MSAKLTYDCEDNTSTASEAVFRVDLFYERANASFTSFPFFLSPEKFLDGKGEHGSNAFHVTLCSVRKVCTKELHRETRLFIEGHKLPVPFSTYHEIYAPKERV